MTTQYKIVNSRIDPANGNILLFIDLWDDTNPAVVFQAYGPIGSNGQPTGINFGNSATDADVASFAATAFQNAWNKSKQSLAALTVGVTLPAAAIPAPDQKQAVLATAIQALNASLAHFPDPALTTKITTINDPNVTKAYNNYVTALQAANPAV